MPTYTAKQAADLLGVADSRVRQLAAELKIGKRFGRAWQFSDRDIAKMRARGTRPGPKGPRKPKEPSIPAHRRDE